MRPLLTAERRRRGTVKRRVLLLAAIVASIAGAGIGGYLLGARSATSTSPAHRAGDRVTVPHPAAPAEYTLRAGDKVKVPGINQTCVVTGTRHHAAHKYLFCELARGMGRGHDEVLLSRSQIVVLKMGNTEPVWSGKP
jgi:hypothetical protein